MRRRIAQCHFKVSKLASRDHTTAPSQVTKKAPIWKASASAGGYLTEAVTRACKSGRREEIAVAAQQFLAASRNIPVEDCVFVLNRLSHKGAYRDQRFWKHAAESMAPRVPEMRGEVLGLAANAFARADVAVPKFLQSVSKRLLAEDSGDLSVTQLTLVLNAEKKAQADGKNIGCQNASMIKHIENNLSERLQEMNDQDMALYLSGLRRTEDSSVCRQPREAVANRTLGKISVGVRNLTDMPASSMAQLVQAFSRLSTRDEKLLKAFRTTILQKLQEFSPQSIAMVANAYAKLRLLDHSFLNGIATVATHTLAVEVARTPAEVADMKPHNKLRGGFDHVSVAQLLNAHAKVMYYHADFFKVSMDWCTPVRLSTFSAQSLANALHAFTKFPRLYSRRNDRKQLCAVFATFVPHVLNVVETSTVQNLVNIVYAFSLLDFYEPMLIQGLLSHLISRRASWNTQDVANLASACARLNHFDVETFAALAGAAPPLMYRFRSSELATLLNALAHCARQRSSDGGLDASIRETFKESSAVLQSKFLREATAFEVALILNAFVKVGLADAVPLEDALTILSDKECFEHPALSAVVPLLNALAQLHYWPLNERLGDHIRNITNGDISDELDAIRIASILSSAARLGANVKDRVLWPWVTLLLRRLAVALSSRDTVACVGPASSSWSLRTLSIAFEAVCNLQGGSTDCAVCGQSWYYYAETLLAHICMHLETNPKELQSSISSELSRSASIVFWLHLRTCHGNDRRMAASEPSISFLRYMRAVLDVASSTDHRLHPQLLVAEENQLDVSKCVSEVCAILEVLP